METRIEPPRTPDGAIDFDTLRADLRDPDPVARACAVLRCCPCRTELDVFEGLFSELRARTHDPDAEVRATAREVLRETFEHGGDALPTSKREVTDDMARTRRRSRFAPDAEAVRVRNKKGRR